MHIGYVRVSTEEQNPARQQELLRELGVDEIFLDRASGKNTDRPELKRMLAYVRKGDTVIVESISRFARNTRDLLELIEQLTAKEVEFVSKKEAIDTTTPTGKFMLTVFAAVAELERDYILQRQRAAVAGQLRRCRCPLAARRDHRKGGHAQDGAQTEHILSKSPTARKCVAASLSTAS